MGFGREALATLREAALVPLDLRPVVPEARAGDDVVVLVHGFLASAGVFRPLRRRLEALGDLHVASFTHLPGAGVRRIALALARVIDRLPKGARVHLVGHSLGGLVARWYVEELGGHHRVAQTIALAAPFAGAPAAVKLPYFVGVDLHPEGELIARLRSCEPRVAVPHCSIIGDADRLVYPAAAQSFSHGEHIVLEGLGHNGLLFDERVARLVVERIAKLRAAPPPPVSSVSLVDDGDDDYACAEGEGEDDDDDDAAA